MATITDSLFSLIIFIYVMVTFLYLFYGFCWIDAPKKTEAEIEEENKLVRFPLKICKLVEINNKLMGDFL